jgi:hypothetical protein
MNPKNHLDNYGVYFLISNNHPTPLYINVVQFFNLNGTFGANSKTF